MDRPRRTLTRCRGGRPGSREGYAYICVRLGASTCSVADCISALRACEVERERLARLRTQFEHLEEIVDAEEQIRRHYQSIERLRRETALGVLGDSYPMYHQAVSEALPGVVGR